MANPLIAVENLSVSFKTPRGKMARAVDSLSFGIDQGAIVGLVGESGCGKSVTALSILGLIENKVCKIETGQISFQGQNLIGLAPQKMRAIRGNQISMIFQEPMTSLNPVFTIGRQIGEVFRIHLKCSHRQARERSIEILDRVKIPDPQKRIDNYPFELSGGMRQRVMIAMALALKPKLLIADEPTTALDVTIQAEILKLINQIRDDMDMSILLITHDLGIVANMCDRVMVMYGGRVLETAATYRIFSAASHPYTQGLLKSLPQLGKKVSRLNSIKGSVPSLGKLPSGCRFQDRCPHKFKKCEEVEPQLTQVGEEHFSACWLHA